MFPNLDDRCWVIDIVELVSSSSDDSPGFAEDVNSSWDPESISDQVGTGIEEYDLASGELQKPCKFSRRKRQTSDHTLSKTSCKASVSSVRPSPVAP